MALLEMNFMSKYLSGNTEVSVILPNLPIGEEPEDFYQGGKKYPVLWLLHGTFGDHTDWVRNTAIESYACEKNLVVVMPRAMNSDYSNWPGAMMGYNMYDFVTKELMPMVYAWLPVSRKREDNYIAGLSMGGRGTIKFAVNFPELFAGAAVLSAAPVDFSKLGHGTKKPFLDLDEPRLAAAVANAGGVEAYTASQENVWAILEGYVKRGETDQLPKLFFAIGEDDFLYGNFRTFREHFEPALKEAGVSAEWVTAPGYKHEWPFWDLAVKKALDWFWKQREEG